MVLDFQKAVAGHLRQLYAKLEFKAVIGSKVEVLSCFEYQAHHEKGQVKPSPNLLPAETD